MKNFNLIEELDKIYPDPNWILESFKNCESETATLNLPFKFNIYDTNNNYITLKIIKKNNNEYYGEVKFWFTNFFVVRTKIYETKASTARDVVNNLINSIKLFGNSLIDFVISFKIRE